MVITNNPMIGQGISDSKMIIFLQNGTYSDVLIAARDKIHLGHTLLTHPLSSSVKPGQTPYKTVIVSDTASSLDLRSLEIIEESISTAAKFLQNSGNNFYSNAFHDMSNELLKDFQLIDFSVIQGGFYDGQI